ncbi:unnamed protein product [Onchocerca flexuosa]|uniref:Chromo domain-containing protein n=1 Tax=Onchocerca flexuosa TaxID=387005 RepID=A0A183HIW2_9BILA|nr:unnamed protein product [Onchocerca flexuosa]
MITDLCYVVRDVRSREVKVRIYILLHIFVYFKIKLAHQINEKIMNSDSAQIDSIEEHSKMNEINKNETKNEDICEDGDEDEELDDDEFEVDRILNVAVMDGEVKYQVIRWKGYGSDEDSWEPEENLETARLILDEYIANHQDEVKKVDAILARKKLRKRCGKRIKLRIKGNKKSRRISDSEHSEVLNGRAKKKMKYEDNLMSNSGKDSDEDYDEVSKKHGK